MLEMQRRRLLLAFADVLGRDGLEAASVGQVCKRAGMSRRTFYELFDGREACFAAMVDLAVERVSHRVRAAYEGENGWRERVRAGLAAALQFFDTEPTLARACLVETLKGGPEVAESRARVIETLVSIVEEGRREIAGDPGPPPLTGQSTVGGAISVLHARLLQPQPHPLTELLNPLMSMIVLPYLGRPTATHELERNTPNTPTNHNNRSKHPDDPFKDLPIRITFRTARVLTTINAHPEASNRQIGDAAGIPDQGQISKLLHRLARNGLIENHEHDHTTGKPNAWQLTPRGHAIQHAIDTHAA